MIQGAWFTAWANGKQNSGQVNFVPESRLLFVQISSIYLKKNAKSWNWYQRLRLRSGTCTQISFWTIPSEKEKTGLSFQMSCRSAGMNQKVEFHLLPNPIFRKRFVKGKQPWFTRDRFINWLRSQGTLICTAWRLNFHTEVVHCKRKE